MEYDHVYKVRRTIDNKHKNLSFGPSTMMFCFLITHHAYIIILVIHILDLKQNMMQFAFLMNT